MMEWKKDGTKLYQQLPAELYLSLKPCEPLREVPVDRKKQSSSYKTWNESKT
jgi:hypothetical protein